MDKILELAWAHTLLAVPPLIITAVLALPLGWAASHYPRVREVLVTVTSLLYVIPSLALFIILPKVLGTSLLSPVNVIIAMTLFGLALQVRSAADAFSTVSGPIRAAATAVGYSAWQRFWKVELPLAGPGLIAGLRVVSASTISLISVGALIGVPSLGTLFTEGFLRNYPEQVAYGLIGCVVLALIFDLLLVLLGWVSMPWQRRV
ncbi:ABC transporter permease [Corynebacterium phocae]|uniref:ABC transporter permease n=1 Tax=Corynebacterium phocae TaxID=161895 RepID=A0A1L7D5C6_9CORY|nr:ABC transporter permease subunit [Corynebacterium phocae]APT93338.1 ABC transporter permease [Corynebacterium phocae]KAA8721670.1 ABC transporter permease subunit [Corynebacterium phocae]